MGDIGFVTLTVTLGVSFLGLLAWSCYREHLWNKERSKLVNRIYAKDFKEYAEAAPKTDPDRLHVQITQEPVPINKKPQTLTEPLPEYLEEVTGVQG